MNRGNLTSAIETKIDSLGAANSRYERLILRIGTDSDNADLHDKIDRDRKKIVQLCDEVMTLIQQAPAAPATKQATQDLSKEMQRFEKCSKELKRRDSNISRRTSGGGGPGGGGFFDDDNRSNQRTGGGKYGHNNDHDMAQQLLLSEEQEISIDLEQMERRRQEIHEIESDVMKISDMFKDLQTLVQEQGEQLDVVESTMVSTYDTTQQAYEELETAEDYQIAARRKKTIVIILLVAVVLIGAIVGIVYLSK